MAIEINGFSGNLLHGTGEGFQAKPAGGPAATVADTVAETKGDQLSLTDSAAKLISVESEVSNLPVVDSWRVAETQRSLATGTFQIDPSRVAENLLAIEKGLP